jgi:von Willebrand factor type A domain
MLSSRYWTLALAFLFTVVLATKAEDTGTCQQRTVVVNPRKGGHLIPGLQPSSFRASVRGQFVKVLAVRANTQPPRVVLLVDLSGSVNRSNHELDRAQFLAEHFMATSFIPRVALVLFSDSILDTVGFDHPPKAIQQTLANLKDGRGSTALFDSLIYSAGLFRTRESGDAIYVITDGGDSHDGAHERDVERELLTKGIRLFCFVVSTAPPPLITEVERQKGYFDLQRLTEATGGSILNAGYDPYENESRELEASLRRGYDRIKSFYTLEVELPTKLDKEQRWNLQLVDQYGKRRKDVETVYARDFVCH